MKKILFLTLCLAASSLMCSCANSSGVNYNNNVNGTQETETSIESRNFKISYMFLQQPIAVFDENGNLMKNGISEVRYWAGHDYDIGVFGDVVKENFYCLGDTIIVTYDKTKENTTNIFPYEVISVERNHTAMVEVVSLDEITRNENGGISSIGGKTTEYDGYNVQDAIYITDTSLKYEYLSLYKGDVLYRAKDPSEGYVYYSFDPSK